MMLGLNYDTICTKVRLCKQRIRIVSLPSFLVLIFGNILIVGLTEKR